MNGIPQDKVIGTVVNPTPTVNAVESFSSHCWEFLGLLVTEAITTFLHAGRERIPQHS
jgi:hypothetical protein